MTLVTGIHSRTAEQYPIILYALLTGAGTLSMRGIQGKEQMW